MESFYIENPLVRCSVDYDEPEELTCDCCGQEFDEEDLKDGLCEECRFENDKADVVGMYGSLFNGAVKMGEALAKIIEHDNLCESSKPYTTVENQEGLNQFIYLFFNISEINKILINEIKKLPKEEMEQAAIRFFRDDIGDTEDFIAGDGNYKFLRKIKEK